MRIKVVATVGALLLALAFATTAVAQSPTTDAYGGELGNQTPPQTTTPSTPSTPSTGVESEQPSGGSAPTQNQAAPAGQGAPAGGQQPAAAPAPATTVQAPQGGSLPFTGLEVGVIVLLGAALIGGGFVLKRMSARSES
jgi:hypothetical protein